MPENPPIRPRSVPPPDPFEWQQAEPQFGEIAARREVNAPAMAAAVVILTAMLPFVAVVAAVSWRLFRWTAGL